MKELLEYILTHLLPESNVKIVQSETEEGVTLEIHLSPELRGKVIGKGGRNIKSIRDVISIFAKKENKRVFLKVVD